jgi:hypothetical protein
LKYESVEPISRKRAQISFSSGNPRLIREALIRVALYDEDWSWTEHWCLHFIASNDPEIRATAILCLGHIARVHGQLDTAIVVPLLRKLKNDPLVGGYADNALSDIYTYMKYEEPA